MAKTQDRGTPAKTPRRSDSTKQRILAAAREAFATLGYDRATVRTIAGMADIHPSMVMRYYATKEGLFTASSQFDLQMPDLAQVSPDEVGEYIVRIFLDRWNHTGAAGDLPALLRLSVTHPEGREKAIAVFTEQVRPALTRVIRSNDPARAASLIATQLAGVAFLRYVLKLPGVVALKDEDLVVHVGHTIQNYIDGDTPPAGRAPRGPDRS